MAQLERRLPQNVDGDFFVDETCIDCDACRQIAPETFRDHGDQSSVSRQPETSADVHRALMALVACPTASIGTVSRRNAREGVRAFPTRTSTSNVFFCGFTSETSFGAWSYLVVRPREDGGNVLVDSPRFAAPLVRRIEEMGGVNLMVLSHRDDIADHAKFAAHFGCPRVMHEADGAARLGIEQIIDGEDACAARRRSSCRPDARPHPRASGVPVSRRGALYAAITSRGRPSDDTLIAFRDACWYSWAGPDAVDGASAATIASSGYCPVTAASTTRLRTRCTVTSTAASSG